MRLLLFFFDNASATHEVYTLSLHDALPIFDQQPERVSEVDRVHKASVLDTAVIDASLVEPLHRSEEHTSELQSLTNLVCRLLLAKKKQQFPIAAPPRSPRTRSATGAQRATR